MSKIISAISFIFTTVGGIAALIAFLPEDWNSKEIVNLLLAFSGWCVAFALMVIFHLSDSNYKKEISALNSKNVKDIKVLKVKYKELVDDKGYLKGELSKTTTSLEYVTSIIKSDEKPIKRHIIERVSNDI